MKKLFVTLSIVLLVLSLSGCKKEETKEVEVLGGWTIKDEEVSGEALETFNKAMEGMTGADYEPVKLIGTQVVSGINYKILCNQTLVTAEPVKSQKIVIIYKDTQGNCSVTSVEDYAE